MLDFRKLVRNEKRQEIAFIGFALASKAFRQSKQLNNLEWLEREHNIMDELIRDSPFYEWVRADAMKEAKEILAEEFEQTRTQIIEQGKAQGIEQGKLQGIEKGYIENTTQLFLAIIQVKFPLLNSLAQQCIEVISERNHLQTLTIEISIAQSTDQAQQMLLDALAQIEQQPPKTDSLTE